ncbi:hypothetical protein AMATHDRAFT_136773 [Amanita thiersii Skay4041]|uniref:ATP-dependent RNA helicase n=1 Tax=Amanita thiersii Skay4041 TaxID=703135 RepID=A0A2A9P056_9AGAR|nr:hypothetical protein AMATHDRAFT_136773 [Amanita thiersii Skay4041]
MDDQDIVLNIPHDEPIQIAKFIARKKGGRWTDRLKAKRLAKQESHISIAQKRSNDDLPAEGTTRVSKRPRTERVLPVNNKQIISSLFTNNPKVETFVKGSEVPPRTSKPSNAPLADSSTFGDLGLNPLLAAHLANKMSISKPTAIQRSALSILLSSESKLVSRDVFIQSQTGSGKTLSFLLPIIQDLLPLSSFSYIDRSIGTLAVIIAPTKELAKQISDILETLLRLRLRPESESADDTEAGPATRMTRWLVSGLLVGGSTRAHEKARLRKGVPILVSTPGRLLDHLQNTSSFNIGKCRWLVLDEADRLMELGFEETITGIINGLDGRRRLAIQAMQQGKTMDVGDWNWSRRRTILCSATIKEDVQKLAGEALSDPLMLKATLVDESTQCMPSTGGTTQESMEKFTPPSQLSQKYLLVPLKLRLVTLVALLRTLLAQTRGETKIVVFFSCTDSVDYHWTLFGKTDMENDYGDSSDSGNDVLESVQKHAGQQEKVEINCALLPDSLIYRLHGSLSTQSRQTALRSFSRNSKTSKARCAILFCTSVASRGLDLPLVQAVIQYDLPTEGGVTEYVHRVGRTARAGKGGEAWCFVSPSETEWVNWIQRQLRIGEQNYSTKATEILGGLALVSVGLEGILRTGFGGKGQQYESRATHVQLAFEKWVLKNADNTSLARNAYLSHIRAYSTHPSNEKHIFHIKHLHIGHLAKAFALREAPMAVALAESHGELQTKSVGTRNNQTRAVRSLGRGEKVKDGNVEKKMQAVVREQGKLSKKGGMMVSSGVSEFQIAEGDMLTKLVRR